MNASRLMARGAAAGFTLIELIIVIVIVGVLAAVAIPKYVDLSTDAKIAALQGVGGGIASGSATNYAAKAAGKTSFTIASCTDANIANITTIPSDMTTSGGSVSSGSTATCSINYTTNPVTTQTFTLIGS